MINLMTHLFQPIILDCKNLRVERQKKNNEITLYYLLNHSIQEIKKICNVIALDSALDYLQINNEQLLQKCREDILFAKLLSSKISILSSRQGSKDESFVIETINKTCSQLNINIENLPNTKYRPTKNGIILDKKKYEELLEKKEISKNDCLKSFDAKISGVINGWIFAKITYTNGGHQDNVFEEAHQFAQWALQYGNSNEIYVLLIDTDLMVQLNELKEKYHKNNILVVNHVEFQNYILYHFSCESK
mgnify:CR=1 FL=1